MKAPLLSIIIPVYNAQKYLKECIESVLVQGFEDYEIIIVNDGSRDESEQVAQGFVERDARVRLYTTENKGVSNARNIGIKEAKGHWLLFLDSDDYLLEESLAQLLKCAGEDTEEVCANYSINGLKVDQGLHEIVSAKDIITMMLDPINHQLLPSFYHLESATLLGVWGKLFRRDLIVKHGIWFDGTLKLSEDILFHLQYLSVIENVKLSDCQVFYYRQHPESVTKNFKQEHFEQRMYLFDTLEHMGQKDPIFVISTMLQLAGWVELYSGGEEKKKLHEKLRHFWKMETPLLLSVKQKNLSVGTWQNQVYKICVRLLLAKQYFLTEAFLWVYERIR